MQIWVCTFGSGSHMLGLTKELKIILYQILVFGAQNVNLKWEHFVCLIFKHVSGPILIGQFYWDEFQLQLYINLMEGRYLNCAWGPRKARAGPGDTLSRYVSVISQILTWRESRYNSLLDLAVQTSRVLRYDPFLHTGLLQLTRSRISPLSLKLI